MCNNAASTNQQSRMEERLDDAIHVLRNHAEAHNLLGQSELSTQLQQAAESSILSQLDASKHAAAAAAAHHAAATASSATAAHSATTTPPTGGGGGGAANTDGGMIKVETQSAEKPPLISSHTPLNGYYCGAAGFYFQVCIYTLITIVLRLFNIVLFWGIFSSHPQTYMQFLLMNKWLRSPSRIKASMVLTRADHLFIHNYIRSFLNIILMF